MADYNDAEGARQLMAQHAESLAAVILEPLTGSGGCIPADPEFLRTLREEASRHGIVLVFDEVMTSRLAPGGLHGKLGVTPGSRRLWQIPGRRGELRRLWRQARPDAASRSHAARRVDALGNLQQQRADHGGGHRRPRAGVHAAGRRAPECQRRPSPYPAERCRLQARGADPGAGTGLDAVLPPAARSGPHVPPIWPRCRSRCASCCTWS